MSSSKPISEENQNVLNSASNELVIIALCGAGLKAA